MKRIANAATVLVAIGVYAVVITAAIIATAFAMLMLAVLSPFFYVGDSRA